MANIDKLNIANTSYNIQDTVSGYITSANAATTYIPRSNYAEITINPSDVDTQTMSAQKYLAGVTSASHPLIGCLTTNKNTRDEELEAFNTLLFAETTTNYVMFYFSEVPSSAFTVQVVGY